MRAIPPDVISKMQAIESLQAMVRKQAAPFYSYPNYALDNFSAFNVVYNDVLYPTVEHAYQAAKFIYYSVDDTPEKVTLRERLAEAIRNANSPHEAKQLAHSPGFVEHVRRDWDQVKVGIMRTLLRNKRDRHEYVRKTLERAGGLIIFEDSSQDSFWGRGPDWSGENNLGLLWMEIRDED